jgi:hypothetical protein
MAICDLAVAAPAVRDGKTGGRIGSAFGFRRWLACAAVLFLAVPAFAVNRVVRFTSPATVKAGGKVDFSVTVNTDAGGGEKIGFFHGEYSDDGGKTWTGFCFEQDVGTHVVRSFSVPAGGAGSTVTIRVRIAFRGGNAGDVDYSGAAIKWDDSWNKWESPPAKKIIVRVVGQ